MNNNRSLRNEAEFLDAIATVEGIVAIRDALMSTGASPVEANGVVGWLLDKATGREDLTSGPTRSKYRKLLNSIEPPTGHDPRGRSLSAARTSEEMSRILAELERRAEAGELDHSALWAYLTEHLEDTGQLIMFGRHLNLSDPATGRIKSVIGGNVVDFPATIPASAIAVAA